MFGRHLRGGALVLSELFFGQRYLISPFHLPLSPSGDPRWFQYGGLFNFVAPGGRRAQRGVGANWLVLGSRGYIRRTLLLLHLVPRDEETTERQVRLPFFVYDLGFGV